MTIAEIGLTIFERTVLHDAIDPHSHPILRRIIYSNHSATIFIPRGRTETELTSETGSGRRPVRFECYE
jgi:hypothetical protein